MPLVATANGTIVAGHQRHAAAMSIGTEYAPVYIVRDCPHEAEVRFNQNHNASDTAVSTATISHEDAHGTAPGWWIARMFGDDSPEIDTRRIDAWMIVATKKADMDAAECYDAIEREFDMRPPGMPHHGIGQGVADAWVLARGMEP